MHMQVSAQKEITAPQHFTAWQDIGGMSSTTLPKATKMVLCLLLASTHKYLEDGCVGLL